MGRIYFTSGIDTDIGKSVVTGMLARHLSTRGLRVITQKLVQTGDSGVSMDIRLHRKLMGSPLLDIDLDGTTCPALYSFPASPHLAAELEHREVPIREIDRATEKLRENFDVVLLEGAGGVLVPLNRQLYTLDFVAERGYPLILVTSGRLGSLNHTLLSLEAAERRGVEVAGVVDNYCPAADPVIAADSWRYIQNYLAAHHPGAFAVRLEKVDLERPETAKWESEDELSRL